MAPRNRRVLGRGWWLGIAATLLVEALLLHLPLHLVGFVLDPLEHAAEWQEYRQRQVPLAWVRLIGSLVAPTLAFGAIVLGSWGRTHAANRAAAVMLLGCTVALAWWQCTYWADSLHQTEAMLNVPLL